MAVLVSLSPQCDPQCDRREAQDVEKWPKAVAPFAAP